MALHWNKAILDEHLLSVPIYNHKGCFICRNSTVDKTAPTIWTPQRLPWNPGSCGMGELWGYKYIPTPT